MDEGRAEECEEAGAFSTGRAFHALTLEEEKHRIRAKAHLALAAKSRSDHVRAYFRNDEEAARSNTEYDRIQQELRGHLVSAASPEVFDDGDLVRVLLSISEICSDSVVAARVLKAWPGSWLNFSGVALRDAMLKLVETEGEWLMHAPPFLKQDKEVVLAAVASNHQALQFASDALKADREVVMRAVTRRKPQELRFDLDVISVLCFASPELRNDKELVLLAVASHASDLEYASDTLKGDREVVLAALKSQSLSCPPMFSWENVFREASEELRADKELVLEAARVDGFALEHASLELRKDKDFVLQVMRATEINHRKDCYASVVKDNKEGNQEPSLPEFLGAASSALAAPGETGPVLSIALTPPVLPPQPSVREPVGMTSSSVSFQSCEVSLLSGTSFTCSLSDQANEQAREPVPKRPKLPGSASSSQRAAQLDQSEISSPCSTVGHLAKLVLAELPRHVQMEPLPERAFIVFTKSGADSDTTPATPWDWNRPLSDFA